MNPSLLEIFSTDARKYAERLHDALNSSQGEPNADAFRRASRRLHHAATLANHQPIIHAAGALQKTAIHVIAGKRDWSKELNGAVVSTLRCLDAVLEALPEIDPDADAELKNAVEGLTSGTGTPPEVGGPAAGGDEGEVELDALLTDLGDAVERLQNDPRNREPLKAMLRRIHRLRALGRIEVLSSEDKALSAVEELILQIADLNATVGPGYLTVFRHAREVLEQMRDSADRTPSSLVTSGGEQVDELKDKMIEKVRRARQVIWVSDLFHASGPHIISCARAEEQAGSPEAYFLAEASQRLERSESLRKTMLEADSEQMRLSGESLALTLRHLRERAIAFNHGGMGRVTRRAAAALRAQLVRPTSRVRAIAEGLGDVFTALRTYIETEDATDRARALDDADAALQLAVLGGEPSAVEGEVELDPEAALQEMASLRASVEERLGRLSGAVVDGLRKDLEQLFALITEYFSATEQS